MAKQNEYTDERKICRMMRIRGIKSALLAAAMFISAAAVASVEFKSGDAVLRLSEKNGAVESLLAAGLERVVPAAEAFTLQLLDGKGEPTRLKSSEFVFEWSGTPSKTRLN